MLLFEPIKLESVRMKSLYMSLFAVLFSIGLSAQDADKMPIPSDDEVNLALEEVKDVFKDEYKGLKTADDRTALAKKLIGQAAEPGNKPAMVYALITEAARISGEAGDIASIAVASKIYSERFKCDAVAARKKMLESAEKASGKLKTTPESMSLLAEEFLKLADEALVADDFSSASSAADSAIRIAKKAKNTAIAAKAAEKKKETSEASNALRSVSLAMDKLKTVPTDPDANFAVGKYLCFIKGDRDKGLPKLAIGSNKDYKDAAELDLTAKDTASILKSANKWWDMSETEKDKAVKSGMRERAGELYDKILAELSGIDKVKAEKRIALSAADPERSGISSGAKQSGEYLIVELSSRKLTYSASAPVGLLTKDDYKTDKLVMRRVPAGDFMMGETGNQHEVTLTKDFYIGVFEVTQGQWEKVMKANPSAFKDLGKDAPVENVSWNDCQDFIKKLNGKSTLGFRLPTEAEWEYASRGGQDSKNFEYSGSSTVDEVAWFKDNSGGKTHHPVGKKKPNELGLYDMSGNVWEWCSDWRGDYPKEPVKDPQGAKIGSNRVLRGGSWYNGGRYCRSADRNRNIPSYSPDYMGFRVVLPAGQK